MSHRLPVAGLAAGPLRISGDDHHYLFRVLRLTAGDRLVLFDGAGHEAEATVTAIDATEGELLVETPRAAPPPAGPLVTALLPLIKGDRTELAIGKLVELGVRRIVPVRTSRGVIKLAGDRAAARQQRYQKLATAAARQSRAAHATEIAPVTDLADALAACDAELRLLAWEGEGALPLADALAAAEAPASLALATGPEGGFADAEVELARAAGFVPVGLGRRILRAETAAIALAAIAGFALGELGGRNR